MSLTPLGSFDDPIFATAPRADASGLYVVQRGGQVRIVRNGSTLAQPFLDISADVDPAGEGGLLSLAFPTDYSTSGLFYVYLTANDANPGQAPHAPIQVREYRRSASDPNRADPASGRIVLSIPHAENTNHYGGTLQFGDDGRLYAGTGDGGGGGDPSGNAQNPESMLGKILRLDPRRNGEAAYGVPQDNPYAARPSSQLVWSTGLRNPYRFAFDRSTGALLIGDVGQNRFEEIDSVPGPAAGRGLNFGWRTCEGTTTYPSGAQGSCATPGLTGPVFEYGHDGGRCSITGGVVSRDPGVEELAGRYLYSDYCAPDVRSQVPGNPASDASTGLSAAQAAAYGEDACSRVHVIRLPGTVGRITDGSAGACALRPEFTPAPAQPGSTLSRPVPTAVTLKTRIARRQKVLRRRTVSLRVACSATCSMRVIAKTAIRRRKAVRLRQVKRRTVLKARTVKVPVGKRARRTIRKALRARRKVTIRLTVRVRGANGRLTVKRLSTRIVGYDARRAPRMGRPCAGLYVAAGRGRSPAAWS